MSDTAITFDREVMIEMAETAPEAFEDDPKCPECDLPMFGSKTDSGPFCARDHD